MPSSIVRGKYILCKATGAQTVEIVQDAALFQRDGEILEIGKYDDIKAGHPREPELGSDHHLIMPGMVNAHHHGNFSTCLMGCPDLPLELWLSAMWARRDTDPYLDALVCCIQLLESGVTTAMHNHVRWIPPGGRSLLDDANRILQAYGDAGMRVAFSIAMKDQNRITYGDDESFLRSLPSSLAQAFATRLGASSLSGDEYLALFEELFREHDRAPGRRARVFLSPANLQWASDRLLVRMKEHAARHRTGIHMHLLETRYQKAYALKNFGKSAVAHLEDLGFLGPEVSCAHGVWLTDEDLDLLARTGTTICHNASSNLRLKSGIAPVNRMLEKGVRVAIGIDSTGLNDDNDMLQEVRLVSKIHRVPGHDQPAPTAAQLLEMATVGGARATLFDDRIGTLEVGKRADMVLLDFKRLAAPYLDPGIPLLDVFFQRAKPSHVETVIIDGEVVLHQGRFTRFNKEDVLREFRERLAQPLKPHELERKELARALDPHLRDFYRGWLPEEIEPHYGYNARS
ncbi:MAG: amidohydrolase family protein [Candidatus Rokubacteria bacterium]|nr:amidohydrolase family protein [Candidatus Rokubacteria bacterium]